jgi:hypothetical protein
MMPDQFSPSLYWICNSRLGPASVIAGILTGSGRIGIAVAEVLSEMVGYLEIQLSILVLGSNGCG